MRAAFYKAYLKQNVHFLDINSDCYGVKQVLKLDNSIFIVIHIQKASNFKFFIDQQNNFFSQQVRTILVTNYHCAHGGSEKVQKCADVIQGQSQRKKPQQRLCRKFFFSIQPSICISKQYFMYFFTLHLVTRLLLRSSFVYFYWVFLVLVALISNRRIELSKQQYTNNYSRVRNKRTLWLSFFFNCSRGYGLIPDFIEPI